jgi:quercetin dioxygenase-like cupin family protein
VVSKLNIVKFEAELLAGGYEIATKTVEPSSVVEEHTHDFDVSGMVTSGGFEITVEGKATHYGVGDQFTMAAGCSHAEAIGPQGVRFTVGRRAI